jgi:hypothetical protein
MKKIDQLLLCFLTGKVVKIEKKSNQDKSGNNLLKGFTWRANCTPAKKDISLNPIFLPRDF